ncbi:uncharacterized protein N7477_007291 [Penicillium maclennaniae]|uniref:uncharacterized protein n=1 Tax=Penicillium maclennaniae TaxID=1343394 RepID=UPI002540D9E6|nr:uncharacterized protein N7477_007291 [Penicillium maclennaniae]KAJ5664843.1 hypothetical protein N7477_007291 [Penicillium maclennaniae]
MATLSAPSTPKAAAAARPSSEGSGVPGKWRHPQLNEIVRRQNAATFGDKDVKRLLWNGVALVTTWLFGNTIKTYARLILDSKPTYHEISLLLLQLFFAFNIFLALCPLYRPKDDFSDIPLTPTQRALLGMDPTATPPATPGTTYLTPPRYRMSTSRKASPSSRQTSPMNATPTFSERRVSWGPLFPPPPALCFTRRSQMEAGTQLVGDRALGPLHLLVGAIRLESLRCLVCPALDPALLPR